MPKKKVIFEPEMERQPRFSDYTFTTIIYLILAFLMSMIIVGFYKFIDWFIGH